MTPQELKNSILQQAIQGKLVEQRPEEGTAEELYECIQAEKQCLIKEKKNKRETALPEITEEEIPFDIPESWKWVRLGNISTYSHTKEKVSPQDVSDTTWILDLEDIEKNTGYIKAITTCGEKPIRGDKVRFHKGQILYSKLRPYLKKVLIAPDDGISTTELVPFDMYGNICPFYTVYFLKSPHADFFINTHTHGVKMPRVGTDIMANLIFPLPPLPEQKRIVAKIEELLPLVEKYEQAWAHLEELNSAFPEALKNSILQQAIQGKLVEQRPEEGTAKELYECIQAEKQRLIKEKKIKKEKDLPEITEEEIPFDIPDRWKWVRLGTIGTVASGGTPKTMVPEYWKNGDIPWITPADMKFVKGKYVSHGQRFITNEGLSHSSAQLLPKGTLVYSSRAPIGYVAIAQNDLSTNQGFKSLIPSSNIYIDFLYYCLQVRTESIIANASGTTFKE